MSTTSTQIQLKVSLSEQLNNLLAAKAARVGVPVTQFVKHLIIKEIEKDTYPEYQASDWVEDKSKKAMAEINNAIDVDDVHAFMKDL